PSTLIQKIDKTPLSFRHLSLYAPRPPSRSEAQLSGSARQVAGRRSRGNDGAGNDRAVQRRWPAEESSDLRSEETGVDERSAPLDDPTRGARATRDTRDHHCSTGNRRRAGRTPPVVPQVARSVAGPIAHDRRHRASGRSILSGRHRIRSGGGGQELEG